MEDKIEPYWEQPEKEKARAKYVWDEFSQIKWNNDQSFPQFRNRNRYEYFDDQNNRFNNFRVKPDWKDDWQANISDITTHSKIMAIVSQVVAIRPRPEFFAMQETNFIGNFKAQLMQDLYDYTDTFLRNGDMDMLFTALRAAREGTAIGYEGWRKDELGSKPDAQLILNEEFFPGAVNVFNMEEQIKCVWRTILHKNEADIVFKGWHNYEHVRAGGEIKAEQRTFFNISEEVIDDKVEIIRYFNRQTNEFIMTANGILIKDKKLTDVRKDRRLGFWKVVYEPFDTNFFWGRGLADLMSDNQDAIDFLFNNMFDQSILSVLKPIFVGQTSGLADDYLYPGKMTQVADSSQVKEMEISGPDAVSFNILQELKQRQNFVSIDPTGEGAAVGKRTATEVQEASENAKKMMGLFITLLRDGIRQKALLRAENIKRYLLTTEQANPIILDNVKLFNGKTGKKIIRIKNKTAPQFVGEIDGRVVIKSPQLEKENRFIDEESEIVEFTPEQLRDFEAGVNVRVPSTIEMSEALKAALDRSFAQVAFQRPDVYDQVEVARTYAKAMGQEPERLVIQNPQTEEVLPQENLNKNVRVGQSEPSTQALKELMK